MRAHLAALVSPAQCFKGWRPSLSSMVTVFQQKVYSLVAKVPKGKVTTYGAIAKAMGRKGNTARAIGQALNRNPDAPHKVPCHRVVSSGGKIGGYGFGGTIPKVELLEKEGIKIWDGKVLHFERVLFEKF